MDQKEFDEILSHIVDGTADETEIRWYLSWLESQKSASASETDLPFSRSAFRDELEARIQDRIRPNHDTVLIKSSKISGIRKYWKPIAIAASLLFFLGIGLEIKKDKDFSYTPTIVESQQAVLTLSNGKKIKLNASTEPQLLLEEGVVITKSQQGEIIYQIKEEADAKTTEKSYNSLETAIGQTYIVQLPDGSKVWLNAKSKLRYPARFNANERRVFVEGEAYFDIAKDKSKPFIVVSRQQEILVTGTQFNVQSYNDMDNSSTTLIEGAVRIESDQFGKSIDLLPGQQLTGNKEGYKLNEVDFSGVLAWKNGKFEFDKEALPTVLLTLSRWYDFEYEQIEDPYLKRQVFSGTITRYTGLKEVLELLELTGAVKFKQQGRRLLIMH